ncbi:TonB-dependent receptor [Rufibacter sp. DG15C]|uniref:outer membrane beta-barrel protein n=1 Tax=Rufibacter sp. DG15C TaxID=1379909 RepID=UPI00078E26BD|nr:outer membrane beta-barrel protein [Rufibacter sp. DG15C]AMM52285.1 TonB-dependent receptor [Rufibacter sp. DG15C]
MKKLLLLFFSLMSMMATAHQTQAQTAGQLSGQIVDHKGEAMSYGTITLLKASDASLVTGAAVEVTGDFKMKTPAPGKYFLRVSAIGFANTDLPAFEVTGPTFSKDFGKVALQQDAKALKEVVVQSLRPTVDVQADKMVVSVENTAMAAGNTAYDVLSKSPGVWIDQDGNIQLNGKAGVQVMIDGKLTYLNGKQLQTMLQGMPAENLKNLEIIANPSAKFDAEGTSGIINLNLKKNTMTGLNGNVYGGYQYNTKHGANGGANVNLKQGKWSSFATADLAERPKKRTFTMDRVFKQEGEDTRLIMAGGEFGSQFSKSLRVGTDYDFSNSHSIGGTLNLSQNKANTGVNTNTRFNQDLSTTLTHDNSKFTNVSGNAHYLGKLDTVGTTLSADIDVVRITDRSTGDFLNKQFLAGSTTPSDQELLENSNPTSYQIYSAKADYTRLFPKVKGKLEIGAKASYVQSDNQIDFYQVEGNSRTLDFGRSDHFIYDENIYAGYVNFSRNLGTKWTLQSGLRAEYTDSKGNSLPYAKVTPRTYLDFFPSIFLQQRVSDNYQISYTYSRRINRPRYENLNPFVFYIDNNTFAKGNPLLKPEYTNSFQVTQTFKKTYNLVLGYAHTKDDITEVPEPFPAENKLIFMQRNVESKNMNATLILPITVNQKWSINNNATLAYQEYNTIIKEQNINNSRMMFMAQSNSNILLPKNFKLEATAGYQGAGVFNVYRTNPSWFMDLGIKRSFLKDQLDVTLNVTDIFRTRKMQGYSDVQGNTNTIDMYHYNQSVRLNLRYRFNKGEKFEMKRRNTNLEELNRAGGN